MVVEILEAEIGHDDRAALGLVAVVALHPLQDEIALFLDLVDGIHMREDIDPLLGPVGIAEEGMALPVLVHHQFHRLVGDRLDLVMERLGQAVGGPAIDHQHAVAGDDEAEIVVVARILVGGRRGGADGREDMRDEFDRFGIEFGLRILVGDVLGGQRRHGERGRKGKRKGRGGGVNRFHLCPP